MLRKNWYLYRVIKKNGMIDRENNLYWPNVCVLIAIQKTNSAFAVVMVMKGARKNQITPTHSFRSIDLKYLSDKNYFS